jgi:hypothetical protein
MINEYTIGAGIVIITFASLWGWKKIGTVMQGRKDRPSTAE